MPLPGPSSQRALILAPQGRDGNIAAALLAEADCPSYICADLTELVHQLELGAGLALIAEEAVRNADLRRLSSWIANQPPWSDLPIILLTLRGGGVERNPAAARVSGLLGNVTFLERPFHPTTLISVVRMAARSRHRQYQARANLQNLLDAEQRVEAERAALAELNETLEQRVRERTDALRAEIEEKQRAQEQLRQIQKIETIGHLTGGVAHDFNNLLAVILGNLELLLKRVPDDPRLHRLINGALQGARRGASLTQRLLAFARKQDLHASASNIAQLIEGMKDLLARLAGPQITIALELDRDLPPAKVDANQLELAVLNLVVNARDAMPEGGSVTVALDEPEQADRTLAPGRYLRLRVMDTGTGMDQATLERAIEPFFSTKQLGKGTGLGLSMVHGLAIQLGGTLQLQSTPGEGTIATMWLPVTAEQVQAQSAAARRKDAAAPAVILVVDDDPLISASTTDMLEDLGHTVIETHSGRQALEVLSSGAAVDLLLTDYAMPEMMGLELAREAMTMRPGLPVLLATGYAELPPDTALNLPRLAKPYLQDQLAAQLAALLR